MAKTISPSVTRLYRRARLARRDRADLYIGFVQHTPNRRQDRKVVRFRKKGDVNVSDSKAKPLLYLVPKDMSPT